MSNFSGAHHSLLGDFSSEKFVAKKFVIVADALVVQSRFQIQNLLVELGIIDHIIASVTELLNRQKNHKKDLRASCP